MISQRIEFEKLLNTRDLGGMTAADGRKIRPGKLFRSGQLFSASENDLKRLGNVIEMSVDFRTDQECEEKPEPQIPGVRNIRIPILDTRQAGVTRDEDSFREVREKMIFDSNIAFRYMTRTYEGFILSDYSVSQYQSFVRLLLEERQKGILWHCTAGKDRAGFASVIVQELLGVSREDIRADYLFTNVCVEPEVLELIEKVRGVGGLNLGIAEEAIRFVFAAHEKYLDIAYERVREKYGTFENYIRDGLRVTSAEQEKLREMYLEPVHSLQS